MTKKLYIATKIHEVVFISSSGKAGVQDEGKWYLKEQDGLFDPPTVIREITSKEEIPADWREEFTLVWCDDNEEITAEQFLDKQKVVKSDKEYQEYLRLKDKFE